ncbi:MAG: OmpA family protein [Methylomonas sp.]
MAFDKHRPKPRESQFTLAEVSSTEQLEHFIMRKAITAISFMLFGASTMIFISALLRPSLRSSISQAGISKTEVYESSVSLEKAIEKPAEMQSPVNQPELAINQTEGKVQESPATGPRAAMQLATLADLPPVATVNDNAVAKNQVNASPMPAPLPSPEPSASRPEEKSPKPTNPASTEKKQIRRHDPESLLVLGEGAFTPGDAKPKADARIAIDQIIPLIQRRPLDKVIVEGHADKSMPDGFSPEQGSKWNKIISTLRAKSIAEVLMQKGVASDRIDFIGLGDTVPLASNLTYEGRSKNRRVEIKLSPP